MTFVSLKSLKHNGLLRHYQNVEWNRMVVNSQNKMAFKYRNNIWAKAESFLL